MSTTETILPSTEALVNKWCDKVRNAKKKHQPAFDQMREDMEFVAGKQWPNQQNLRDERRYITNLVLRETNQSVASLYAKNPKAIARRRERMDNTAWDGTHETLLNASQTLVSGVMDPNAVNVIQDYAQAEQQKKLLDNVAKTLELAYQVQIDRQEPNFKLQMKQLVRRVKVTGVGFVRVMLRREGRTDITVGQTDTTMIDRAKKISALVAEYDKGDFSGDSVKIKELEMLMTSLAQSQANTGEMRQQNEKLVFEFPMPTSIIVDPDCRMMKGFVGAKWLAQEYILPLDDVKATFGKDDINYSTGVKEYTSKGEQVPPATDSKSTKEQRVCVWEVFDKTTKSRFFLCDGYKDFLMEPEEPRPVIQRFWPVIALTFNDIEIDNDTDVSVYPPSDVRLMRSAQLEWNRTRECLRKHRKANRPKYLTGVGWLDNLDKEALSSESLPDSAVVELRGVQPGQDISKLLAPFQHSPVDPALYDTTALERDILTTVGAQQATLGPITNRGTATEATISEQSRLSSTSSNVDDLDELLSEMAIVGSEMMLREMSKVTVQRDVGIGAVWPETNREDFVDRIFLEVQAASTGRPNQGLRIANAQTILPLLLNAGANPVFVVEELIKAYDERIDVQRAFPIVPASLGAPPMTKPVGPARPNGTPAGPAVPLPVKSDAQDSNNFPSGNPS